MRATLLLLVMACVGCAPLELAQLPFSDGPIVIRNLPEEMTVNNTNNDKGEDAPIVVAAQWIDHDTSEPPTVLVDPGDADAQDAHAESEWQPEPGVERQDGDWQFTLGDVVAHAVSNHPAVHAAARDIEVARAAIRTATTKENPNLVIDFDSPLGDDNDASELTSRITFPFGKAHERHWRRQVALAQVVKSEASFQQTLRSVSDAATAAALKSIYLQHRLVLDERAEQLAHQRNDALAEAFQRNDPARNLLDQVQARIEADRATQIRFATLRELAVTHVLLANRMGLPHLPSLTMRGTFDQVPLSLPPLDEVLSNAEVESESIAVAMAELNESRVFHSLQRNITTDKEFGPRYQDRLGRNDDSLGVRFEMDLDLHRTQLGPIVQSGKATHQQEDRVALARHQWLGTVTSIYRELESLTEEVAHYHNDGFIEDQRALLDDEATARLLTASQRIEIEQSIVGRMQDQLERVYRLAVLRSQIRLEPGVE